MAAPTLTTAGQRIYDGVAPLAKQDEDNGFAIALLSSAFATMLDPVVAVVSDSQDGDLPGWAPIFDTVNTPEWLDFVGQFVGVSRPAGMSDANMAMLVTHPTGFNRGTLPAITTAIQATLSGSKTVLINARAGGNPFEMTIATLIPETPFSGVNLEPDPGFEYDTFGTAPNTTYWGSTVTATTYTLNSFLVANAWSSTGKQSLRVQATHDGTTNSGLVGAQGKVSQIPVSPGQTFTLQCVVNVVQPCSQGVQATHGVLSGRHGRPERQQLYPVWLIRRARSC